MVAGIDRYYQIVRCFRDEDLRADRHWEFTQLDLEMSFATEEDVFSLFEGMFAALWRPSSGVEIATPVPAADATTRRWDAVRVRQARHALRPGARRPHGGVPGQRVPRVRRGRGRRGRGEGVRRARRRGMVRARSWTG